MSVSVQTWAWGLDLPHEEQFVLIALADHAHDDGSRCFPGVEYLAWKCGLSERSVQRVLRKLEGRGLIEAVAYSSGGQGRRTEYQIHLDRGQKKAPYQRDISKMPPSLRPETIARFERTCQYCKYSGDDTNGPDGKAWHIDRIIPGKHGGRYIRENVTLSCGTCNRRKGAKMASKDRVPSTTNRVPSAQDRVPSTTSYGAKGGTPTINEPSQEPPREPSVCAPTPDSPYIPILTAFTGETHQQPPRSTPTEKHLSRLWWEKTGQKCNAVQAAALQSYAGEFIARDRRTDFELVFENAALHNWKTGTLIDVLGERLSGTARPPRTPRTPTKRPVWEVAGDPTYYAEAAARLNLQVV